VDLLSSSALAAIEMILWMVLCVACYPSTSGQKSSLELRVDIPLLKDGDQLKIMADREELTTFLVTILIAEE